MTELSRDLREVMDECSNFHHEFETVLMATCNAQGEPNASYAPYIEYLGDYYIYVSELANHTENLTDTEVCSLMFIEDEKSAKHIFARQRKTLLCDATEIPRDVVLFDRLLKSFPKRFGSFMDNLRGLTDFHLFRLRARKGSYVAGFAQAYTLKGEGLKEIKHRNGKGHQRASMETKD